MTLDQQLSEAQRVLRDGTHDTLSQAVATARDTLVEAQARVGELDGIAAAVTRFLEADAAYDPLGGATRRGESLRLAYEEALTALRAAAREP